MQKDKGLLPAMILAIICIIATALLAFTNQITLPTRLAQEEAAENENKLALFPEAQDFRDIDIEPYLEQLPDLTAAYEVYGPDGEELGTLFAAAARGYGGDVPIMAAVNAEGKLSGVRIMANEETPGLGKKIEEQEFLSQFVDKDISIRYSTKIGDPGKEVIDSVSGATISSRAVTESLNEGLELYSQISGGES